MDIMDGTRVIDCNCVKTGRVVGVCKINGEVEIRWHNGDTGIYRDVWLSVEDGVYLFGASSAWAANYTGH